MAVYVTSMPVQVHVGGEDGEATGATRKEDAPEANRQGRTALTHPQGLGRLPQAA